jgi:hypothetical protein
MMAASYDRTMVALVFGRGWQTTAMAEWLRFLIAMDSELSNISICLFFKI